jgi:plastocyanin
MCDAVAGAVLELPLTEFIRFWQQYNWECCFSPHEWNKAYEPQNLTAPRGTTVTWVNSDYLAYKINANDVPSVDLIRGDAFSHTFNTPGTYNHAGAYYPRTKGTIIAT